MALKIVHSSIDENGKISSGVAGDQTSKEVCIRSWYNNLWNVCLRYPDTETAKKACEIGGKLAKSNLVGYNQSKRNSLYAELKKNGWDVDKYIKSRVKTECDCSSFIYACYCCVIAKIRADGNAPTTRTMKNVLNKYGFLVLTDDKYLTSINNLKAGDVLIHEGSHTVMAYEETTTAKKTTTKKSKYYSKYTGDSNSLVDALCELGIDSSKQNRTKIANANGIAAYAFSYDENVELLNKLKKGLLIKP